MRLLVTLLSAGALFAGTVGIILDWLDHDDDPVGGFTLLGLLAVVVGAWGLTMIAVTT